MPVTCCPNCDASFGEPFYRSPPVPSHSCLLMDSPAAAREFPTGPLELAFCDACGFIGNAAYDASLQAYSVTYEETQHFSSHFTTFARDLAQQWIDDHGLRGKHLLEIGCGKGEFLELMCQLGDNRGTGIDPSCIPERLPPETRALIDFRREYYGPKHAAIEADAILCRHTLEHIPATREFLSQLRATIPDGASPIILFELPDTKRVLREGAFWDIYYEHCSYFTAGSLARLFRSCGFEVLQLERVYDEQYLILSARPSSTTTEPRLPIERELEETRAEVGEFAASIEDVKATWRQRVTELADKGRVIAWGSGSKCVAFLTTLDLNSEVAYVVDINPHKHGKFMPGAGHPISGPDRVHHEPPTDVVIMNPVYQNEIRRALVDRGCEPTLHCLGSD